MNKQIDNSFVKTDYQLNFKFAGRSQGLFALVFLTRYLDLFTNFISLYNTAMKIFFLVSSIGTVYLMFLKFKATYDHNHDTFRWVYTRIGSYNITLLWVGWEDEDSMFSMYSSLSSDGLLKSRVYFSTNKYHI